MREDQTKIRITVETRNKIRILAKEKGMAQITILEYLLNGKIPIEELK